MMALILTILISPAKAEKIDRDVEAIMQLAEDYRPERSIAVTVARIARNYGIEPRELAALAMIESGFNPRVSSRLNANGTTDVGMFQINSVNRVKCKKYNIETLEGNTHCAAMILAELKTKRSDYLGAFHSKTPSKKIVYLEKIRVILKERTVAGD